MKGLYLVIGESGSGKDTLVDTYCKETGSTKLLSLTDREKRSPDENTHTFVTKEEFDSIHPDELVAYTKFNGHQYGATAEQVNNSDFYIIDVKGLKDIEEAVELGKIKRPVYVVHIVATPWLRFTSMYKRDGLRKAISRIKHDKGAFEGLEKHTKFQRKDLYSAKDFDTNYATFKELISELERK